MSLNSQKLQKIPTNIITGYLGVGKTTTILSLLEIKPEQERWAVLVNEFGEIGIDGSLFQGQHSGNGDIFISEVPGGCMCCAAGLPMTVALNQLLSRAKPQRLIIEPTGLGHPKGILETLYADNYRDMLDIQKTVTLVDARKLSDSRYTSHDTFNQQIDIADIIVGNKRDLYEDQDQTNLENYIAERKDHSTKIIMTDHGNLDPAILEGRSDLTKWQPHRHNHDHDHHHHQEDKDINEEPILESGYIKKVNEGEGFHCIGWRFSPEKAFRLNALLIWFKSLNVKRVKAVLITDAGAISYNQVDDMATINKLNGDQQESRIEIISREFDNLWEPELMACLLSNDQS